MNALKDELSIQANPRDEFSVIHIDVARAHFHPKAQRFVLVRLPCEDMGKIDAGKSDRRGRACMAPVTLQVLGKETDKAMCKISVHISGRSHKICFNMKVTEALVCRMVATL